MSGLNIRLISNEYRLAIYWLSMGYRLAIPTDADRVSSIAAARMLKLGLDLA
jgi:hypothetical protein